MKIYILIIIFLVTYAYPNKKANNLECKITYNIPKAKNKDSNLSSNHCYLENIGNQQYITLDMYKKAFSNLNPSTILKNYLNILVCYEEQSDSNISYNKKVMEYSNNELKMNENSIKNLDTAIKLDLNNSLPLLVGGILYSNSKYFKKSEKFFTKIINKDKQSTNSKLIEKAYIFRAHTYTQLKDYTNAIIDYTTLIETYPTKHTFYYSRRAFLYTATNNPDKSLKDLEIILERDKNNTLALHTRAKNYYSTKQYKKSILEFTKLIEKNTNHIKPTFLKKIYYYRADSYNKINDFQNAIDEYYKIMTLYPNDTKALMHIALLYFKQKNHRKVLTSCDTILKKDTTSSNISLCHALTGMTFLRKRNYKKSIKSFQKSINTFKYYNKNNSIIKNLHKDVLYYSLAYSYYLNSQPYLSLQYYTKGILKGRNIFNIFNYLNSELVLATLKEKLFQIKTYQSHDILITQ